MELKIVIGILCVFLVVNACFANSVGEILSRQERGAGRNKGCRYSKGEWGECLNGMMTRTLTLKNTAENCEQTKTISKPCSTEGLCKYERGEAGECANGQRTITKTLLPDQPDSCQPTKTITRECRENGKQKKKDRQGRNEGRERKGKCTFGSWTEFGACENGAMTRTREITSGNPERCQKRSVQTRAC